MMFSITQSVKVNGGFVLKTTEIVEKNLRLRLQARSDGAGHLKGPRDQGPEVKH